MMEIRDFVRDVLVNVVEGIKDAQKREGVGGYVAPDAIGGHSFPADSGVVHQSRIVSTVVKFDMAVTAESSRSAGGDGKLRVAVIEANLGGTVDSKNVQVSRIQFSVPVLMPQNLRSWSEENGTERR